MKSFKGMALAALAMAQMSRMASPLHHREDPLEGIDIEKEYFKIIEKRSGLSRRLREMVIDRYEMFLERNKNICEVK
jgi:hypothetical protein